MSHIRRGIAASRIRFGARGHSRGADVSSADRPRQWIAIRIGLAMDSAEGPAPIEARSRSLPPPRRSEKFERMASVPRDIAELVELAERDPLRAVEEATSFPPAEAAAFLGTI